MNKTKQVECATVAAEVKDELEEEEAKEGGKKERKVKKKNEEGKQTSQSLFDCSSFPCL